MTAMGRYPPFRQPRLSTPNRQVVGDVFPAAVADLREPHLREGEVVGR